MPSKTHEWLSELVTAGRAAAQPTLAQERENAVRFAAMTPVPDGVVEETFPGLAGALLFSPPQPRDDLVILYVHGGGFRTGTATQARAAAGLLAVRLNIRAVVPEYRLAPEDPFPDGLDDCECAYGAVRAAYPEARIVVVGESAGAGLAAGLLLRRRDAGDGTPLAGVLWSGVFDLRAENLASGSWVENAATDAMITPWLGPRMAADYLAGSSPEDPQASPARANLTGLPPLMILASGSELLRDDSVALAARAAACGVETMLELWPYMHHAWPVFGSMLPESLEALDRTAKFVRRVDAGRFVDGPALMDDPAILALMGASQEQAEV
ncbi:alpha/beta hydrolase fold domain-containing protein [Streptomyces sp. NPDC005402]|uniref:alpha/beta hydrolase n=1 Tax=Streptomyces sp. NPDC005402 TaxID=3155338 RepID=UPI0033AE67AA